MIQLRRFRIKNFKSIKEIDFQFNHLNILIGMNGSGKSTILQSLDFISQLMHGNISDWLNSRDWKPADLSCKLLKESNIEIEVEVALDNIETVIWTVNFNRSNLKCTYEKITINGEDAYVVKSGKIYLTAIKKLTNEESDKNLNHKITLTFPNFMKYEGSLLAKLELHNSNIDFAFKNQLIKFKNFIKSIKSLELLAPHLMRKSTRVNDDNHVGIGGEKLSSYIFNLNDDQKETLIRFLKEFYPNVVNFKTKNQRSGWKKLLIEENSSVINIEHEARHINDGLLRILAILAQLQSTPSFLMLDEIENGVNQEIIEKLVTILLESQTQLLITTHSPLVLNYLPDDIAIKSVNYIYKNIDGSTSHKKFFEIDHIKEKLDVMGVGDAVLDTNLIDLTNELNSIG